MAISDLDFFDLFSICDSRQTKTDGHRKRQRQAETQADTEREKPLRFYSNRPCMRHLNGTFPTAHSIHSVAWLRARYGRSRFRHQKTIFSSCGPAVPSTAGAGLKNAVTTFTVFFFFSFLLFPYFPSLCLSFHHICLAWMRVPVLRSWCSDLSRP